MTLSIAALSILEDVVYAVYVVYAECHKTFVLSVVILNVIMLSVIMLNFVVILD